jgi:hypothetical protein
MKKHPNFWKKFNQKRHGEAVMVFLCSLFLLFSLAPTLKATDLYEPNDSFETATLIEEGEIEATIDPAGDLDYFQFNGLAGRAITIDIDARSLVPPSLLDSVIYLYDASKAELVQNDDYGGSDSLILNFTLPTDGIYYIKVVDYNGAGGQDYFYVLRLLGVTDAYEPNDNFEMATPIKLGDVISAIIGPAGDLDYFQFNGSANQTITINIDAKSLVPSSLLDSVICLYDASKANIACNNDYNGSDSLILNFILPTNGIYYIKVEDYNGVGGQDYFYILRLLGVTDVYEPNDNFDTATLINFGDVISAVIAPAGDLDYFKFNGKANQAITIDIDAKSLIPPSWLCSTITLYDANKNWLASSSYGWPSYSDPQILYTLPRDGIYYIMVRGDYGYGGENYFYILRLTGGIHDITVSNRTHSGVTISWWTHGNPVTGVVNYGTTTALGSTATDDNLRNNGIHYVNITGLTANTQYFFEVISGSEKDDNNGQYYTFMTAKVPQDPPDTYNVFGNVYKDYNSRTPAPHSIKYFWLKNANGESSLLSALTNDKGYWLGDLSNAKSGMTNDVFPFAAGDTIYAYAQLGKLLPSGLWVQTSRYTVSGVSPQQFGDEYPLAVELASFTAGVTVDGVTLNWRTISEINNLGFNVYRSVQRDGKYELVNAKLIGGAGTDATPHDYSFTDDSVKLGQTCYYYIEAVDFAGKTDKSDIIEVTVGKQGIKTDFAPPTFALLQNYPNPFNPETWIPFKLAQNANVVIRIYSAKGQLIRTITLSNQKAGDYVTKDKAAYWDGRDSLGEKVASGVYFYTIQAGEFSATRKMVVLK